MGRHQFPITLLFVCEKWMRTSTRLSLGGCARLSLTWGLGCSVGVGWVGSGLGVGPAGLLVRTLGKYLDPVGDRDRYGPQNPVYRGTKITGTVLVACQCKRSRVTWQLAVQFRMS